MLKPIKHNFFQSEIVEPILLNINSLSKKNAFCINGNFYSYKQLGQCISKVRWALQNLPAENVHIGLVTNDDLETYASIFAIWLQGKAYIPLHPDQPIIRCEEIISQIDITTILDSSQACRFLKSEVINTSALIYSHDFLDNNASAVENALAYVLFTSGSTGSPKGVQINRKNVGAFMNSFWHTGIVIDENDKCLQCFDLTFDVSVQCLLAPLVKGACVYTIPHDQIKYSYAYGLMEDEHLTFMVVAPSMLRYLKPYFEEIEMPYIKHCIVTGEASPASLIDLWKKCIPKADIYNFYGPTETTIYCTYYKVENEIKTLNGMLSIGKPLKNAGMIIVDENCNAIPNGEKGELCIYGDQVSPGYWNNSVKNAEVFLLKEVNGENQQIYRTGDLCYCDKDGDLLLYGRLDSQTKIQGYRVELEEIEYHAREYLNGNNAIAVTFINNIGNTELALFVEGSQENISDIINYLKTKMPFYMIPTKILFENEFQLNANGKVDRKKLKAKINTTL